MCCGFKSHLSSSFFIFHGKRDIQVSCIHTVRLEKLVPFCYRCTFLKRCDHLHSVQFYYRSPFRFFCLLHLNGTVSPPFLGTCNTYVRTYYVHRRDTDKTYASCWLARVAVGSLVLQCLRRSTAITQINTTALRRTTITQLLPLPGPQTWGYITNIEAGGNQGNRTRNRQVFS